jgi:excinuclease UvrABC nuclease subunit
MAESKSHVYAWGIWWIEFKVPSAEGVYSIRNKEGQVLYVGKGNVRERLLSHWNKRNSGDEAIWSRAPYSFRYELTDDPEWLEDELIRVLRPPCNPVPRSFFGRR